MAIPEKTPFSQACAMLFVMIKAALSSVLILALTVQPAYCAPAVATSPAALAAPDLSRIGVVAAVKGTVKMGRHGQVGELVKSGRAVFIGDEVATDDKSQLQRLLIDETVFTIGPNSSIIIDKFVYDPASQSGKVEAQVVKGAFRFVTGKIARHKPSDMHVKLPSGGSIGVRGTIVAGKSDGNSSTVILLGPGSQTNTDSRVGQITVGNEVGGEVKEVTVTRPGYGSTIEGPGVEPTPAFEVPVNQLESIMADLQPPAASDSTGEEGGVGSGDPSGDAGQDTAAGGESADILSEAGAIAEDLNAESAEAAQGAAEDAGGIQDGVAFIRDLLTIGGGIFHYHQLSVPLTQNGSASAHTYSFDLDVDFDNRKAGGTGNSQMTGTSPGGNFVYALGARNFGDEGDPATFTFLSNNTGGCSINCGQATIHVSLLNEDGSAGENARHDISFTSSGSLMEGNGTTDGHT